MSGLARSGPARELGELGERAGLAARHQHVDAQRAGRFVGRDAAELARLLHYRELKGGAIRQVTKKPTASRPRPSNSWLTPNPRTASPDQSVRSEKFSHCCCAYAL